MLSMSPNFTSRGELKEFHHLIFFIEAIANTNHENRCMHAIIYYYFWVLVSHSHCRLLYTKCVSLAM